MRILFVTAEYPPDVGGVGAYTSALARALAHQGADVAVLTSASGINEPEQVPGITAMRSVKRWGPSVWHTGARLARDWRADWLHVQYQTAAFRMNPAINLAPSKWRALTPATRVAWTYHDLLPPYLFPKAGARLRNWVTVLPGGAASLALVTNAGDLHRLEAAGVTAHQIPIGSNVPQVTLTLEERGQVRERYGLGPQQSVVGYFGFLNRSKGAPTLLRTLRRLRDGGRDVRLLLIGEGLGASDRTNRVTQAEALGLIAELDLAEFVTTTGALSDADVARALNCVDVLLLPFEDGASLRRGTLMAGLLNGNAIVTTPPQAPMPELTIGRDLLVAPPGDDSAFAAQVARLLDEPALTEALRRSARAASAQFTWQSIAAAHLALYSSTSTPNA